MCWSTYFIVLFEQQPKIGKKWLKKTITFHILQNTGSLKNVLLQPAFFSKIVFCLLTCLFWKQNIDVEQENRNKKSGKTKDNKKAFERKNKTGNQKKRKDWRKQFLKFNSIMLFFSWNKSNEERKIKKETKKEPKESNKKRQEGRKKEKNKRETEKEEVKKGGGQKRLRETKGDTQW